MVIRVGAFALSEADYDKRDWQLKSVLKTGNKDYPVEFYRPINETIYQGQIGMCSAMGFSHSELMQNIQEYGNNVSIDKFDLRIKMGHNPKDTKDTGDSAENAVKTANKLGILGTKDGKEYLYKVDGYGYSKNYADYKYRNSRFPIVIVIYGDSNTWNEMLKGEVKTIKKRTNKSQGHLVCGGGYNLFKLKFINSFGDKINKNGVSQFTMTNENFAKAVSVGMINWRYFAMFDKKELKDYAINIELSKQAIKPLKKLYDIGDDELIERFKKWGVTSYLENKYGFKYE